MGQLIGGPFDGQNCNAKADRIVVKCPLLGPLNSEIWYECYVKKGANWYCEGKPVLTKPPHKVGHALLSREVTRVEYQLGGEKGYFLEQYVKGTK